MAQQTAVMQLIKFILVERRQEDGSIKFHAHEDFSKFLQMEKEQIMRASKDGISHGYTEGVVFGTNPRDHIVKWSENYYNETYGE